MTGQRTEEGKSSGKAEQLHRADRLPAVLFTEALAKEGGSVLLHLFAPFAAFCSKFFAFGLPLRVLRVSTVSNAPRQPLCFKVASRLIKAVHGWTRLKTILFHQALITRLQPCGATRDFLPTRNSQLKPLTKNLC